MDPSEIKKRVVAAQMLLSEGTTTREKFNSVKALIAGINPKLDKILANCDSELSKVEKYFKGAPIELILENLPELTEEQKKRKKALLFFINTWNQLRSEVKRVEEELESSRKEKDPAKQKSHWANIFNFAKGPFGITTLVAVGVVIVLQTTSVRIMIKNNGCGTIQPPITLPISLPGLSLPKEPIPNNGSATVTIFPVTVRVNGMNPGEITLSAFGAAYSFQLSSSLSEITLNGDLLMGKETEVNLSAHKEHLLILTCR